MRRLQSLRARLPRGQLHHDEADRYGPAIRELEHARKTAGWWTWGWDGIVTVRMFYLC